MDADSLRRAQVLQEQGRPFPYGPDAARRLSRGGLSKHTRSHDVRIAAKTARGGPGGHRQTCGLLFCSSLRRSTHTPREGGGDLKTPPQNKGSGFPS